MIDEQNVTRKTYISNNELSNPARAWLKENTKIPAVLTPDDQTREIPYNQFFGLA